MHIVLVEPEIPPNTGNVARLCAATCTELHLIEPLGFSLDDRYLKRAGLDYWPHVRLKVWPSWEAYRGQAYRGQDYHGQAYRAEVPGRLVMTSAREGQALHDFAFQPDDALIFGRETRGLPEEILQESSCKIRIPIWGAVRSLNLSTAAGIVLYQALHSSGLLAQHQ